TLLAISFFHLARSFHWTAFTPTILLGCAVFRDARHPLAETVGYLLLLAGGSTVGALGFRYLHTLLGIPGSLGGVAAGGLTGRVVAVVLPVLGMNSACVRAGSIPPPGPLGVGWGKATPVVILVGCVVYGAAFAAILAGF